MIFALQCLDLDMTLPLTFGDLFWMSVRKLHVWWPHS